MARKRTGKNKPIHPWGSRLERLEEPQTISLMIKGLAGFCGLLLVINLFVHLHGHFEIESVPGFYGVFGFIAFAFIVIATKYLREIIGRKETYYSPNVVDGEHYPPAETDQREYGDD